MLTKMMKFLAIAALLLAVVFWSSAAPYSLPLRFVVSLSAVLVAVQAVRARRRYWALAFYALALLFNPFAAVLLFSGNIALAIVLGAVAPFAMSLAALKTQPLLSIPSITGRTPGSESL